MNGRKLLTLSLLALLATGCREAVTTPELATEPAVAADPGRRYSYPLANAEAGQLERAFYRQVAHPELVVGPGESIQDAVDRAAPGAVIHIEPGIYHQSVVIDKPGLRLVGRGSRKHGGVVLVNPGGVANGITVLGNGDGVAIANLTTRGYGRNGVFLIDVQGFLVMHVSAEENGEYGIYPVRSSDGLMMHNLAVGHADAGLYIGQSERVQMLHNRAYGNVIGMEISNSSHIVARHNHMHDNTIGVFAVLLPLTERRTVNVAADILLAHNLVEHNNLPNFADPRELPAYIPRGAGMLVVGTDRTLVEHNTVRYNDWVGIGVGSTATLALLANLPPEALEGIEPDPDHVTVRRNLVMHNGADPPPPPFPLPGVDLLWDATGTNNCWEQNQFVTSFVPVLPSCR